MSSQRGNLSKKGKPKHKNDHAFKNDKYDTTGKMKAINNLHVSNVCQRCKDCIEWKIKYKKYKPLTVPGKCIKCTERKVKFAYHIVCTECALKLKICAKCNHEKEVIDMPEKAPEELQRDENYLKEELKHMKLREKRSFLRNLEKNKTSNEIEQTEIDENKNLHCEDESDNDDDDDNQKSEG